MHRLLKKNNRPRTARRGGAVWILCLLIAFALFDVWATRTIWGAYLARRALAKQGFQDVSFHISRLTPGCVLIERLRLGAPVPVLSADWAEVRFSLSDVVCGLVGRVRLHGVRTSAVVSDERVFLPLLERLSSRERVVAVGSNSGPVPRWEIGEFSCSDLALSVCDTNGVETADLRGSVHLLSDPAICGGVSTFYRFYADASDGQATSCRLEGSLDVMSGTVSCGGELRVGSVDAWVARAARVAPRRVSRFAADASHASLTVRGSVTATNWAQIKGFEVAAELGRGSAAVMRQTQDCVRFQSLRVEASGTPADIQGRLSAGISGLRVGDQLKVVQDEGRLLSIRGTGRFRSTPTNRWVQASLDSEWPGRSLSLVLVRLMPLVSRLLTDGGTLHAEADVVQPLLGAWSGEVRYAAEARRSAVSLPAGRVGAGRMTASGAWSVRDSRPDELRVALGVEDGYYFGNGLAVKGNGQLSLVMRPPFAEAAGVLSGSFGEYAAFPKSGIAISNGVVRLEGEVAVTGLATAPVWRADVRMPDFGVSGLAGAAAWSGRVGGGARVRWQSEQASVEGGLWLRDVVAAVPLSNALERAEGGAEAGGICADVHFSPAKGLSGASAVGCAFVSNGWARAGRVFAWKGARTTVPFTWSAAGGLSFCPEPELAWDVLEAAGARIVADGFAVTNDGSAVCGRAGVRIAGSRFGATAALRLPLGNPRALDVRVAVPETGLAEDDALTALARQTSGAEEVAGRVSAEADVRFLGGQLVATGRVSVAEARFKKDTVEIGGLAADVPFESGLAFRTVGRPEVSFRRAKIGDLRLDAGRAEFQLSPQEVFVDRVEVAWCKGLLHSYSIHLDPKNPKADVVVYADRVDLGEALMMVMPFKGAMEGVLYGRFPVGIDGSHIRLSTGFLYSLPGQGGKLRLDDAAPMSSLLERAGVTGEVQGPLAKALSDMDFSAIRLELEPKTDGDAVLRVKLDGKSNFKEWPAPVALTLNLHGPLEKLVNVGVSLSKKK